MPGKIPAPYIVIVMLIPKTARGTEDHQIMSGLVYAKSGSAAQKKTINKLNKFFKDQKTNFKVKISSVEPLGVDFLIDDSL